MKEVDVKTYGYQSISCETKEDINKKTIPSSVLVTQKKVKVEDKKTKEIKITHGLKLGAYSIILAYLAIFVYVKPFYLDFIPFGLSIDNVILIPESFLLLIILFIASLSFSILGTVYSAIKLSLLGVLLSLIVLGNSTYFVSVGYEIYQKNPTMIQKIVQGTSFSEILSKVKFGSKENIKKMF